MSRSSPLSSLAVLPRVLERGGMRRLLWLMLAGVVGFALLTAWTYRVVAMRNLTTVLASPSVERTPESVGLTRARVQASVRQGRTLIEQGGRIYLVSRRHTGADTMVTDVTVIMREISAGQWRLAGLAMVLAGLLATFVYIQILRIRQRYLADRETFIERTEQLLFRASHDELTGLPTHSLFIESLGKAMSRARREDHLAAVLCIAVTGVREAGEQAGLQGSEQVLRELAQRMSGVLRQQDALCRYCGNEFLLLLDGIRHVDQATAVVERLFELCIEPVRFGKRDYKLGMHIGISCYPFSDVDAEGLIGEARMAMNRAAEESKSGYRYFSDAMQTEVARRLFVSSGMEAAMRSGELSLHYQPKINLASWQMKGAEALLRWEHPQEGMISPVEFIPVIEQSNLIIEVGEWVLREACRTMREWKQRSESPLTIAVNVSPRQFQDPDFVGRFVHIVAEQGCEPADFELEITEGSLIDDVNESIGILRQLKGAGFRLAIDDFGTGYSSLSYLQRFPVDTLKIDRAFVRDLHVNKDSAAIVTTIMGLSHNLRMDVVAEGVELMEQLTFLNALGCRNIQGYLFSKPVPRETLFELDIDNWRPMLEAG